jgi:hypothetical protein
VKELQNSSQVFARPHMLVPLLLSFDLMNKGMKFR